MVSLKTKKEKKTNKKKGFKYELKKILEHSIIYRNDSV